jgi:hypothetical protein
MERLSWQSKFNRVRNVVIPRLLVFCLSSFAWVATGFAAKFSVTLDRDTVVLGETVTLAFKFEGIQARGMPQLPTIPGLQLTGGTATSSSYTQRPDGQMESVQTYSVPMRATREGEIQIPSFTVEAGNQRLVSPPVSLKVLREDPTAPPASLANQSAFLWLVLPRQEYFLGEVFTAELRLYVGPGVRNIDGYQPPQLQGEGFSAGPWRQAQNYQRRVGDRVFTVVPIVCQIIPAKSGPLKIGAMNTAVVLNPPDAFEGFFGRRSNTERVALALAEQEFRILPLPEENRPPDFTGAVGQFTMTVNVGPTNVAAGDPITVRVQISGRGALDGLNLPPQNSWRDFKTYPPTAKVETTDQLGLQGVKTFEQIISPESTDIQELPPLSFSFFDPETKTYRTLTHPATKLVVRPGGAAVVPSVAANLNPNASDAAVQPVDIVPIKQRLGKTFNSTAPLLTQPIFLAAQSVPVLAFLAAFVWRKRANALANNPRLRRQRQVEHTIRAGLEKLRQHAAQNQSDEFFVGVMRLLQERLGERLDCPATAITEAVIDDRLRPRGLPDSTLEELHQLFQWCNQARYAPVRTTQELNAVLTKLENALRKLAEVRV